MNAEQQMQPKYLEKIESSFRYSNIKLFQTSNFLTLEISR
jgi:hypothetical protein